VIHDAYLRRYGGRLGPGLPPRAELTRASVDEAPPRPYTARGAPDARTLGATRPLGFGFWPLPQDDPKVSLGQEPIRIVTRDGALVRGSSGRRRRARPGAPR